MSPPQSWVVVAGESLLPLQCWAAGMSWTLLLLLQPLSRARLVCAPLELCCPLVCALESAQVEVEWEPPLALVSLLLPQVLVSAPQSPA